MSIFREYDIRGLAETDLNNQTFWALGRSLGELAREKNEKNCYVGQDVRLSSPRLANALASGLESVGLNVRLLTPGPTPLLYFCAKSPEKDFPTSTGFMITGSHNPPQYNGLKMVIGGTTLSGNDIQDILRRLEEEDFISGKEGSYKAIDITEEYVEKIVGDVKLKRQMNIIVDCGNGVAGKIAPKLYRRMGAKVLGLFCDVDGNFPNHHPDPSQVANLKDLIDALKNPGAEVGLAFDGDGDRLGVVTRDGKIVYPDRQMMMFVADVLEKNPGGKIIYDVKSSRLLAKWIEEHGGQPIMCRTGHSFIKAKIKETGAILAGEMSGHIFFNDRWYGADDGVYAGARLLEILSQLDDPTELLDALPEAVSTPELNIKVSEGEQHTIIEKLQKTAKFKTATSISTIDGLRVEYDDGFGLVRASNTTPVLVLRFEADTEDGLERIQEEFRKVLVPVVKDIGF